MCVTSSLTHIMQLTAGQITRPHPSRKEWDTEYSTCRCMSSLAAQQAGAMLRSRTPPLLLPGQWA